MKIVFYTVLLIFLCNGGCRADPLWKLCDKDINISRNIQLSKNIDALLIKLVSDTPSTGFSATSFGYNKDKVYGLAQCRGDVSRDTCSSCIKEAAKQIQESCPNQSDSRIWYDFCFLRYSQENFIGKLEAGVGIIFYNVANVTETDAQSFNRELGALIDKIRSEALEPSNQGLGKGTTKLTPFATLYALVQCNKDQSKLNCAQCLAIAVGIFPTACNNKRGCQVNYSSCRVRYELYPFFFPLDPVNSQMIGTTSSAVVYP